MLDGVTILSEGVYSVSTAGVGIATLVLLSIAAIAFITGIILAIITKNPDYLAMIIFVPFLLLFASLFYTIDGPTIECPKYKVTIDETVNFAEFMDRYKILSQDGLIYEIIEKRADSN